MRKVDAIVVHCSDSPDTLDIGAAVIRKWHTLKPATEEEEKYDLEHPNEKPKREYGRGWLDIGYHYVVRRSGEIECGRLESQMGAHCPPLNARSLGVCWVGQGAPSPEQHTSLVRLVRELMDRYYISQGRVFGHREADPASGKTCPNIDMDAFRKAVGP